MVNKRVKENILVPIGIALRINGRCNQVCSQFGLIAVFELHDVLTCVENRVGISPSNGLSKIAGCAAFALDDGTHLITMKPTGFYSRVNT
jgi:hypothetical protein